MNEKVDQFINQFDESLSAGTFIKMSLGNYKGSDVHLQKIMMRIVAAKRGTRLFVQYKYETRDVVKNYPLSEGRRLLTDFLEGGFRNAHLFSIESDLQLDIGKRNARLNIGKPSIKKLPSIAHDREKTAAVDRSSYYLRLLGITGDSGEVLSRQFDKWKQINKFVEILANLYRRSDLVERDAVTIVDMGSGKGYLTFAAYDYFTNTLGLNASMKGVDARGEQIKLCNEVAVAGGYEGLSFEEGMIGDVDAAGADIVIALHACDTATDDAIFKGISAGASMIVTAPCCHREVRPQLTPPPTLEGILRHPVMLTRMSQMITDGLRSLILEREGYATRMIEFVDTEHTPMNVMLTSVRQASGTYRNAGHEIERILAEYAIKEQHLLKLLETNEGRTAEASAAPVQPNGAAA